MRSLLQAPKASLFRVRTFNSLRLHYNYRLFFSGQFLSQTGTWLQNAAMAWLVLELTHSALAVGVLAFWQFGPYVVLGLFGGALSDRFDHRRTLVYTQISLGFCSALAAALTLTHVVTLWEMYAIAATRGLILVMNNPSQQAFIVQMVGRKELPNAIALNSSVINATRILGPGLGGLLIAAFGVGVCFSIDAISYGAVVIALLFMHVNELLPIERGERQLTVLQGVGEGLRFVRRTPPVLLALTLFLFICLVSINFTVLLPLVASDTLNAGANVFGFLTACFGAGALIGALVSASIGRGSWAILLVGAAGFGISEGMLALQHTVIGALVFLIITGIFYTLYTSNTNTLVQLSTPGFLQGRVVGLYSYIFAGSNSLGALIAGGLAALGGTELAFLAAGATALVCAISGAIAMRDKLKHVGSPEAARDVRKVPLES
jgi:MFS family permease